MICKILQLITKETPFSFPFCTLLLLFCVPPQEFGFHTLPFSVHSSGKPRKKLIHNSVHNLLTFLKSQSKVPPSKMIVVSLFLFLIKPMRAPPHFSLSSRGLASFSEAIEDLRKNNYLWPPNLARLQSQNSHSLPSSLLKVWTDPLLI